MYKCEWALKIIPSSLTTCVAIATQTHAPGSPCYTPVHLGRRDGGGGIQRKQNPPFSLVHPLNACRREKRRSRLQLLKSGFSSSPSCRHSVDAGEKMEGIGSFICRPSAPPIQLPFLCAPPAFLTPPAALWLPSSTSPTGYCGRDHTTHPSRISQECPTIRGKSCGTACRTFVT